MKMLCRSIFTLLILTTSLVPGLAHSESAEQRVANFQSSLVEVMKEAETLDVQERYNRLKPIVSDAFNLPLMAGLSAGDHWKSSTPEQRKRLVTSFSRMSIATLATLFSSYSGEEFKFIGTRDAKQRLKIVDTELDSPKREKAVMISYVTQKREGDWRLIDVIVNGGISELRVRISEYRQTLKKGGIEALISLLDQKANQLLS
jgi:phospholipid transport system substrate-binding protein